MGMYNEVFAPCPTCRSGRGYAQVHQIVDGFGGFSLDYPEGLAEDLTKDQLIELREAVTDLWFECQDCGESFQPYPSKNLEENIKLARELFEKEDL